MLVWLSPRFATVFPREDDGLARDLATPIGKEDSSELIFVSIFEQVFGDEAEPEMFLGNIHPLQLLERC